MTGVAGMMFPHQADGSLIEKDGKVIGSVPIGQNFTGPTYFHGRWSATTDFDSACTPKTMLAPYNAQNSGRSNAGPTSKSPIDCVRSDADKLAIENLAAPFQVPRVASARKLPEDRVRALVTDNTIGRLLGIIGEAHVNVLALNMALDTAGKG